MNRKIVIYIGAFLLALLMFGASLMYPRAVQCASLQGASLSAKSAVVIDLSERIW